MNGLADEQNLRLRFDVLTKTKQPELCRYWTTRDRAANVWLFRLAAEVLQAIASSGASAGRGARCETPGECDERDNARDPEIGKSQHVRMLVWELSSLEPLTPGYSPLLPEGNLMILRSATPETSPSAVK
jgi:hypothetical protein